MCLNPLHLKNPTKRISIYGGQPAYIDVPCGNCADCRKAKRLEWYFRTYHMVDETLRKGGYVLYDTLTYRPADVPMLSRFVDVESLGIKDHMVFDSSDWRKFLKKLRRHLNYHYPGVEIKYFLTSEYGTNDLYTHRPHYHIMLFVLGRASKSLHPFKLSRIISHLWTFGRTDGLPYKDRRYVAENVFGFNLPYETSKDVYKVCGYISKYITKDSTFQKNIDARLKQLQPKLSTEEYEEIKRNICQYHRQSQGFGAFFADMITDRDYKNAFNGICQIADSEKVKLTIPLPLYYKRRLFYKLNKSEDGTLFWTPNAKGHQFIEHHSINLIKQCTKHCKEQYANASNEDKAFIDKLLNGRSFEDYSIYKLFYKDRFRLNGYHRKKYDDTELNLNDWLETIKQSLYVYQYTDFEYHERDTYLNTITLLDKTQDYDNYIKNNTFTETSNKHFYHFDKLYTFLKYISIPSNNQLQATSDYLEQRTKVLNVLYYGQIQN